MIYLLYLSQENLFMCILLVFSDMYDNFYFQILSKCSDIKWHFIGHLQRNKVKKVLGEKCATTSFVEKTGYLIFSIAKIKN